MDVAAGALRGIADAARLVRRMRGALGQDTGGALQFLGGGVNCLQGLLDDRGEFRDAVLMICWRFWRSSNSSSW